MKNEDKIKELEESIKKMQQENERDFGIKNDGIKQTSNQQRLVEFILSIVLSAVGVFMIFENTRVSTSFGILSLLGVNLPGGLIIVPLLVGIVLMFVCRRKIIPWIVIIVGVLIILAAILMSVHITWQSTSLYVFVIMFGLVAVGIGLFLKSIFFYKK